MCKELHLLSESAVWITESEFTDSAENHTIGKGESQVEVNDVYVTNTSWIEIANDDRIINIYSIEKIQNNYYRYQSNNPALGTQVGTFSIDRNRIYSKFAIISIQLNGFEIIIRNGNTCYTYGALYNGNELINTWIATMRKTL